VKADSCFSQLRNKILGFWYSVKFAFPRHNHPSFRVCGGSPCGSILHIAAVPRLKDQSRRFFYAFFWDFTLPKSAVLRVFAQHVGGLCQSQPLCCEKSFCEGSERILPPVERYCTVLRKAVNTVLFTVQYYSKTVQQNRSGEQQRRGVKL
jgi:hypothetical protein